MQQQHPTPFSYGQFRELPQVRIAAYLLIFLGILELVHGQWSAPVGRIQINFMMLAIGLALFFGGARVVAAIRWLALFVVVPYALVPVQQALIVPVGLTLTQLYLYPGRTFLHFIPMIITGLVVLMVALRLNSQPVKAVLLQYGRGQSNSLVPLVLGLVLFICATCFLRQMLAGPDAEKAANIAANQFGTKYKYFTNRLNLINNNGVNVYATVQMWNDTEVLEVPVQWRK